MWIKLHLFWSGDEVAVQTQNICMIAPYGDSEGCTVSFIGSENNYIQVKEMPDEIGAMIAE